MNEDRYLNEDRKTLNADHALHFLNERHLHWIRHYQHVTLNYIKTHMPFGMNKIRILDVGASEGYINELLQKEESGKDIDYLGIDVRFESKKFNVIRANIEDYELEGDYDLIIISHVLEHLENYHGIFKKLADHTKSGAIFVAVPLAGTAWADPGVIAGHINLFNESNLRQLFIDNDFTVIERVKVNFREDRTELWMLGKKY